MERIKRILEESKKEIEVFRNKNLRTYNIIIEVLRKETSYNPSTEILENPNLFGKEIMFYLENVQPSSLKNRVLAEISCKVLKE